MTDHITLPRSVVEQAINDLRGANLCSVNGMSSRAEARRLIDGAIAALRAALAGAAPTTATVRYDLAPTLVEGVIRDKLINMGWTPPGAVQAEPVAVGEVRVMGSYGGRPSLGCLLTFEAETRVKVGDKLYSHPPQPAQPVAVPVLVVQKEPDYTSRGHFYEGSKPWVDPTKVWALPIGTKLYTAPQPAQPAAEQADSDEGDDGSCPMCGEDGGTSCGAPNCGLLTQPAQPVAALETHDAMCPALDGGRCNCSESPVSIDKAWARFCGKIGRGKDAPYPGMIEAFEAHYGQSFCDKDWRTETAVWAAAWKAAMLAAAPTQPVATVPVLEPLTRDEILDAASPFGAFEYGDAQGHKRVDFARAIEAVHNAKLAKLNGFKPPADKGTT